MADDIKDIVAQKNEIALSEQRAVTRARRKADWKDAQDRSDYVTEKKRLIRANSLPRDMRCPRCKRFVEDPAKWVVSTEVLCRQCHFLIPSRGKLKIESVFIPTQRWKIDGAQLHRARQSVGVSRNAIASHCGWSYSYYSKLESGNVAEICDDSLNLLLDAFWLFTKDDYNSSTLKGIIRR